MSEPCQTLAATLDAVWACLDAGARDRTAPARHPVLATMGAAGPEARTVVLRGADRATATIEIFTDRRSAKVGELSADPRAALVIWDPRESFQIRLRARCEPITGEGAAPIWEALPAEGRTLYGGAPAPGTPLSRPEDHAPAADRDAFCVLVGHLSEIETLYLGRAIMRRARFRADNAWAGEWCAP